MHRTIFIPLSSIALGIFILLMGCKSNDIRTIDVDQVLVPHKIGGIKDYSSPSNGFKVSDIIQNTMNFLEQDEITFFTNSTTNEGCKAFRVVALKRDYTVAVYDVGQSVYGYDGTYNISTNGEITLKLNQYQDTWPVMRYLITDSIGGALYPAKGFAKDVDAGWELNYSHDYTNTSWFFKCLYLSEDPKLELFIPPNININFPSDETEAHFELSVGIYSNGHPTDASYVARDIGEWEYTEGDWRILFVEEILTTAMKWKYSPLTMGKSVQPCALDYDCYITKQPDGLKWVIKEVDDGLLIYDSSTYIKE